MNETSQYHAGLLYELYGKGEAERLIDDYKRIPHGVLRDMASHAMLSTGAPSDQLERIEGRREAFFRIMALREVDSVKMAEFLYGETIG